MLWKRAVILFGKARAFFEAGVDSSVLDCFKKSEATPPNGINQRFLRNNRVVAAGWQGQGRCERALCGGLHRAGKGLKTFVNVFCLALFYSFLL